MDLADIQPRLCLSDSESFNFVSFVYFVAN